MKINSGCTLVRVLTFLLLLWVTVLISGCAGTAQGVDSSVYSNTGPRETYVADSSGASALVIIRYPAMIHAYAENLYVSSFAINAIGGEVPFAEYGKPQTSRIAQSVIEKSSYYAMSLYNELKKVLPTGSVLLSPHIIAWDKQQKLHSRPILASEQIPSVLTIDFSIYSFPDVNKMMNAPPVTFGDLVTPLIVVKSNRWSQPALNGLLIASPPLLSSSWRQARQEADEHFRLKMEGAGVDRTPSLDFVAFLGERNTANISLPLKNAGEQRFAIEQYPLEKIQMDGGVVANLSETNGVDPFERGFVKGASARIVEVLNTVDHERATFFDRQLALERFDPELANIFFVQSSDESVRARLRLAEALVGAEREFLAAQSDSIYNGTYAGNYGAKMRKIISAEYRMLEERRHLARVQNITSAVAVIVLAGSVYGAVASTAASTAAVTTMVGAGLAGSVWAMHQTLETRTESEEVNRYFLARMAPAFDRQMAVQMEWLESKELITARGFSEFRNKTLSLYQSRVRSMVVQAGERCRFNHPGFGQNGRWFGVCNNGIATGRGYGLVSNERGDIVEYLGEVRQGLASGSGGMIMNRYGQMSVSYYEGSFRNGLPHGVLRVEKTGQRPAIRTFRDGIDIGKASAGKLKYLSFESDPMPIADLLNP